MSLRKSRIEKVSFIGKEVGNYEFRRTADRLTFQAQKITSYQLINASLSDSVDKGLEIFEAIQQEKSETQTNIFGLWFARQWEKDTLVNRSIGLKRYLFGSGEQTFKFSKTGVVDRDGMILHWGELEITHENFSTFSNEVSLHENGGMILCDLPKWVEFRGICIDQFRKGTDIQSSYLSHILMVKLALTLGLSVLTVTKWVEDDVIDFDLFKKS